ncbi:MAG: hypothetical protein Q7S92_02740 [Candidatus Diapherotrites archaeon]|nr:hypothetical protein [Candidatus Diapherotrites archaeon]
MNDHAQIFSLDAIISLILVIFALGIIFGILETNSYNLKEQQIFEELRIAGRTAANVLIASPELTCTLTNSSGTELFSITHCLDIQKVQGISTQDLELPSDYQFSIQRTGILLAGEMIPENSAHIYSEKRTVFFYDSLAEPITKQKWMECKTGNPACALTEPEEVMISIWRVP